MLKNLQGIFRIFSQLKNVCCRAHVARHTAWYVRTLTYLGSHPHVCIPCQHVLHFPKHFTCTMYNPKFSLPPMSRVHSTAPSKTLTVTFAFHSTYRHLYTSWNSPSCVYCTVLSVTYAFQNINGYFMSVKEWVLPRFCQGVSSATFLSRSEFCHVSVKEWVLPLCFCQGVSSATLFLSRSEFCHFVFVKYRVPAGCFCQEWLPALRVCHVVTSGTLFLSRGEFRPFLSVA